jgi:hypothetical protein
MEPKDYAAPSPTHITPLHPDQAGEGDTFWPVHNAASGHTLTDHGGPKISNPKLFILDYGPMSPWLNLAKRNQFASDLMTKGYLGPLASYGVLGSGSFLGSLQVAQGYGKALTQSLVFSLILNTIAQAGIPKPDGATIYAVFTPDDVTVQALGGSNCQTFCGFHSSAGNALYAVIPSTACPSCHGPNDPFAALCMVTAHEVAETVTDPLGTGWWEDSSGEENADICAWQPVPYGPWTVQPYWTNESGCTSGVYSQPPPPPPGPPPPGPPPIDYGPRVTALEQALQQLKTILRSV